MPKRLYREIAPLGEGLAPTKLLEHDLDGVFLAQLAQVRRRRQLALDRRYRSRRRDIDAVLGGFEWKLTRTVAEPAERVSAIAWNIERGKRFEPLLHNLLHDPALARADLMLLTEVDKGMARSGNRDIAAELAEATGMDYVFVNHHLVLARGDRGEQDHTGDNTFAMHGSALLSRFPIRRFTSVGLPEYVDKFHDYEKRLGCKRALIAEVLLPDGPLTIAVAHLDPFAPPRHRVYQMQRIIDTLLRFGGKRVLLGGDLNTNTYDVSKGPNLLAGILYKASRLGVTGAIEHYLEPERRFERSLFDLMREVGFELDPFNVPRAGTLFYDAHDPEIVSKARAYLPAAVVVRLQKMVEPWGGVVPMHLDWWAGHGLTAEAPEVIIRPTWHSKYISDHYPIAVDLVLGQAAGAGLRPQQRRRLRLRLPTPRGARSHAEEVDEQA